MVVAGCAGGLGAAGRGVDLSPLVEETEVLAWGTLGRRERLGGLEASATGSTTSGFVSTFWGSFEPSTEERLVGSIVTCCGGQGV